MFCGIFRGCVGFVLLLLPLFVVVAVKMFLRFDEIT